MRGVRGGIRLAALALALGATTACDADLQQDDDHPPQVDVVRAGLVERYADGETGAAVRAEGECFADRLLDAVSLEELVGAEVVDDKGQVSPAAPLLTVDVAGAWFDAFDACADYATTAARAITGVDPAAFKTCFDAAVPADAVRAGVIDTLTGRSDTDAARALGEAQATCAAA